MRFGITLFTSDRGGQPARRPLHADPGPWVALATAVATTERIRLGTCVALPLAHDPIILAKTIASLDHLSGGRVVLGAGFGWNLEEMRDHGVDPARRRAMLREYLEAMRSPSRRRHHRRLPEGWGERGDVRPPRCGHRGGPGLHRAPGPVHPAVPVVVADATS